MTAVLEIRLFGGLQIRQHGTRVAGFISSKVSALLVYLAVTGRTHHRETLAGLLWGEMADADARNNLRQALTNLRKLLAPYVLIDREWVGFNHTAPHTIDFQLFQAHLSAADPESSEAWRTRLAMAAELYQGELLAGLVLRDAPGYEEWLWSQRARCRELALNTLHQLTDDALRQADYTRAIDWATRLLALDSWREEAHQQLMLALARSGQRSAALAQYERCRHILAQELNATPSVETRRLHERIQAAGRRALPTRTTPLVGRTVEIAAIGALLKKPDCRLLTLVGPGGIGKTRLAVAAAEAAPTYLNGICFIPLDAVKSGQLLLTAVAAALNLPAGAPDDPRLQLLDFLRQKEMLLVLDSFEHLLAGVNLIADILTAAPEVTLLITSRERLNLPEEVIFTVTGLLYPRPNDSDKPTAYSAVQLFYERAQRTAGARTLNEADLVHIVHICQLLDGLPLGIELAAAWAHALPCAQIAQEIEHLETPLRGVADRHRSLRAAFEHSWKLLSPVEQKTYRELSVFFGGISRSGAAHVAGIANRTLGSLVDKSLLVLSEDGRYHRHPLLWRFAVEKAAEYPEEQQAAEQRHNLYYTDLLAEYGQRLIGPGQNEALAEIGVEMENVRLVWQRLLAPPQPDLIFRAVDGLYHIFMLRSWFREGHAALAQAHAALDAMVSSDPVYYRALAYVLTREARLARALGQLELARNLLVESHSLHESLDDEAERANVLNHLGATLRILGQSVAAEQHLQACLDLRRRLNDRWGLANTLLEMGGSLFLRGAFEDAQDHCREGLALAEEVGDRQTQANALTGLCLINWRLENFETAREFGQKALAIYETLADQYGMMQALLSLGQLTHTMGDEQEAQRLAKRVVVIGRAIGDRSGEAEGLLLLGRLAAAAHIAAQAMAYFRAALNLTHAMDERPLTLEVLGAIAQLMLNEGAAEQGAHLARFLTNQAQREQQRASLMKDLAAFHLESAIDNADPTQPEATARNLGEVVDDVLMATHFPFG